MRILVGQVEMEKWLEAEGSGHGGRGWNESFGRVEPLSTPGCGSLSEERDRGAWL